MTLVTPFAVAVLISDGSSKWTADIRGVTRGGTGVTTIPANGQLLIGNGTGYTVANLTAGNGVTITNASGSITLTAQGYGNLDGGVANSIYGGTTAVNGGNASGV
jgi:hypothetical protein